MLHFAITSYIRLISFIDLLKKSYDVVEWQKIILQTNGLQTNGLHYNFLPFDNVIGFFFKINEGNSSYSTEHLHKFRNVKKNQFFYRTYVLIDTL